MGRRPLKRLLLAGVLSLMAAPAWAADPLADDFRDPPQAARPRVWWHWMNGNISKPGIKLDLEWMQRSGVGGFQNFDAALMTPQVVDRRLIYMTPEWKDAFRYTTQLADQLGLEMAIAGSPGWSESGGPWVEPQAAMKKLVWSETSVAGGKPFKAALAAPPAVAGGFQDQPKGAGMPGSVPFSPQPFYRDSVVIAFPTPAADRRLEPKISSNGGEVDAARLSDGKVAEALALDAGSKDHPTWIAFDYGRAQAIASLTIAIDDPLAGSFAPPTVSPTWRLQASDDGQAWREVAASRPGGVIEQTISFAPVTARLFRVVLVPGDLNGLPPFFLAMVPKGPPKIRVAELTLRADARVSRFEDKAGFSSQAGIEAMATPASADAAAVKPSEVIDLTARMRPDGTLDWTPPAGRWTVLRMGYSLTGHVNGPASPEATGLEVDKLSVPHVRGYIDAYLAQYRDAAGPGMLGARGVQAMISDSWEAGPSNWTEDLLAEFQRRRGYDPRPFLPAMTGRVVGDAAASDRFLWDVRRTIADLIAQNHYGELAKALRKSGLIHYGESHEAGRAFLADGMEVKKDDDIPMAAMWVDADARQRGADADIRESASVAHIYGQNLVAAESLTTIGDVQGWGYSPAMLKPTADRELSDGVNRFVLHTSVHQPETVKAPGLGLGPFGQWFTRNETWAEQAHAWTAYLARSSYLLQQGQAVADVAWFYGEDSNITALYADGPPPVPAGYQFDFVNADALAHAFQVRDGRLTAPSGMSYRVLALDPRASRMSVPVLRRLRDLVAAGAVVVGARPTESPSQADDPSQFAQLAEEVWGAGDGGHALGKGRVYPGGLAQVLAAAAPADFTYEGAPDAEIRFVHRRTADADIYFVNNRKDRAERVQAAFRIAGKAPELWHAEDGRGEPVSYRQENGRTVVPLELLPNDAVFLVFRRPAAAPSLTVAAPSIVASAAVEGGWKVAFQPGRGAPAAIDLPRLQSFTDSADPGVRYFSGVASYSRTVQAPKALFARGARQYLDLGEVRELAEVRVNGKPLGVVWHAPYRIEATGALKPGANTVEIKVANLWPNRLIGDKQPGATPIAFASFDTYGKDSPLTPSGLIGPVKLVAETPGRTE